MSERVVPLVSDESSGPLSGRRFLSLLLYLLLGAGAATFGLLPWLVTGLRLPLQNLWATDTASELMPRVLLPFSQYAITLIIGVIVTGAGVAGLGGRVLRARRVRWGVPALIVGVLIVQVAAVVQTTQVVRAGLQDSRSSTLYLAALVGVAVLSVLVGVVVVALVAAAPEAGAVVALSIAGLALGPWLNGLLVPFGTVTPSMVSMRLLGLARWVPAVVVGAAIAWGGVRTVGRLVAAAGGLLLLWVVPALTTAISSAAGTRVLARYPAEMFSFGAQVFAQAVLTPALVLPPIIIAVAVAALGRPAVRIVQRITTRHTANAR